MGEPDHPHAERERALEVLGVVFERLGALDREDRAERARVGGAARAQRLEIRRAAHPDEIGIALDQSREPTGQRLDAREHPAQAAA